MAEHVFRLAGKVRGREEVNRRPFRLKLLYTFALCLLGVFAVPFSPSALGQSEHPTLHTVREVRQLSNIDARNAFPVKLEGVITYSDPEWGLLFLADETGSIYVNIHGMSGSFPVGSRLHVDAVTGPGDVGTVLIQPSLHVVGEGVLPAPERHTLAELNALKADSHFVETRGVLSACDQTWKRICFRISDGKASALLAIPAPKSTAAQGLVGATARVRGVSGIHLDSNGKIVSALILVNRLQDIEVEGGASQNLNALAVIVHKENPVNNLSLAELRDILLGKRLNWTPNQEIVVLLPRRGSSEREAALHLLQMDDSAYDNYWADRASQGKVSPAPTAVPSTGLALSLVSQSKGALAVVPWSDVRDTVKVLKIDGHLPSDSAYALR